MEEKNNIIHGPKNQTRRSQHNAKGGIPWESIWARGSPLYSASGEINKVRYDFIISPQKNVNPGYHSIDNIDAFSFLCFLAAKLFSQAMYLKFPHYLTPTQMRDAMSYHQCRCLTHNSSVHPVTVWGPTAGNACSFKCGFSYGWHLFPAAPGESLLIWVHQNLFQEM